MKTSILNRIIMLAGLASALALPGTAEAVTVQATYGPSGWKTGTGANTITGGGFPVSFTPGANGMLIVTISGELTPSSPTVTYAGTPMTLAVSTNRTGAGNGSYASVWYLPGPSVGDGALVVTSGGTVSRYNVYAIYATGVSQGAPEATAGNTNVSALVFETDYITPTADALVVTTLGGSVNASGNTYNSLIYTNNGPLDGQTTLAQPGIAASISGASYMVVANNTPVKGHGEQSLTNPNEGESVVIASFAAATGSVFDHIAVTTSPASTNAGEAFEVTITGEDINNNPVNDNGTNTITVSSASAFMEFDWNRDGTYGDTSGRFVNGTTNILARNKKAETTTIAASGGGAITLSPASFTTTASAFSKLQILAPGETAAPGTTTGKTGTPTVRTAGVSFNVTVNAVDPYWNLVDTVSDTIAITSTDSAATLPANAPLFAGNGVFAVTLNTPGSFTVTATDVDDPTKTASTTPPLTVLGIPLVWVGDWTLNLWDTTSLNWYDPAFSLVAFTNGNQVTFDDSGSSSPAVNIVGTVMPDTMTVNSASDYVFGSTSGGSIGGTGPLTKQGTGSLTLGTANTFSGITLLSGGTLILNHHLALQNSPLQFTSVTAPLHLGAGITNLVLGGLQKTGSELPINTFITTGYNDLTQLTLNVAAGRTVSYSDIINNTTNIFNGTTNYLKLVKDGPGWQGLTAANGFTGGVEIRNGTLALNTQYGGRIPAVNTLTLGSGANSGVFQLGASTGGLAGPNSQTLAGLATSGTGTSNAVVGGNPVNSTITINNTLDFVYAGSFGGPGVNENNLNVTKSGPGKLTLLGSSTHVGATTVNGGTLLVNNSTGSGTGSGAVTVNGGTLGGTGTIGGALTVNANGTLAPGASIGTLTLAVPPTLNGKVVMELDTTQSPSNDVITVTSGTLTAGGTLIITNLPGSTLALGDSFKLFSAPVAGSFSSIVYPEAPSGTAWTNKLAVDGSVALVASAPTPTNLTFSVSGGDLILDWPAGQGWQLQAQTNALTVGITTNWVTVPGAVPPYTNAVNPANGSVFYRLVYP